MRRDAWTMTAVASALTLLVGCGTADGEAATSGTCAPNSVHACDCPDGTAGTQLCSSDGLSLSPCSCGSENSSSAADGGGLGSSGGTPLPCDVASVVNEHCGLCHGVPTQFTAPMSLVSWEDFQAVSPSNASVPVHQMVLQRVQDDTRPMPQPPNPRLSAEEIAVLDSWVKGGMPKGTEASCGGEGVAGTGGTDGGAAGSGAAGSGVAEDEECFDFFANNGDKATPYDVPTTPDLYHCFYFAPPWGSDPVQALRSETVIDNSNVIHHWILYSSNKSVTDGSHADCPSGTHDGQFIVGWAPGSENLELPADVGLELPGVGYVLEVHYNAKTASQKDASGVKLCVTRDERPNVAATHPLGREGFNTVGAGTVTGTCKPKGPFPITILSSFPHMHLKGTHMKTIVKRNGGATETLIDTPFDFNNQISYETPMVINDGDTLETTCTYNGSAKFGTGTTDEMCYNFILAYPAGALAGALGYSGLSNNGNTCIGVF